MKHNQFSKKLSHNCKRDEQLLNKIIADACTHFKVTLTDMLGTSNIGDISLARKVVLYLGYVEAGFDYRTLRERFNRSSHSRCLYAYNAVKDYLSNEETPTARKIIKFFKMNGYLKDRYKPYVKLNKAELLKVG